MAEDEPDNLILVYLRRLDAKLDRALADIGELKHRQGETQRAVLALRRDQTADAETVAHVEARVDRLADRLERIEKRLDIIE